MPSPKFKYRVAAFDLTHVHVVHLELGDCLLSGKGQGCACGLRDKDGAFVAEVAQHLWSTHRAAVLAEHGARPFPAFAAVLFDAVPLPEPQAGWTDSDRGSYNIMCEELERARAPR